MVFYLIFIVSVYILMFLSKVGINRNNGITVTSKNIQSDYDIYYNVALLIIICVSAFRFDVGWDFMAYYETIAFGLESNIMLNGEVFTIFLVHLSQWINFPQLYFILNTLITIFLINSLIKEYSKDKWVSLIFFITFPLFYLNSFSVIRNFTAISITFYSIRFLFEGKKLKFIVLIIVASLFHKSALIGLAYYPLSKLKIGSLTTFIALISAPILRMILTYFINNFFSGYTIYTGVSTTTAGTKAIYLLVGIMIFIMIFRKKLVRNNSRFQVYYNIFFMGVLIYLSFYSQGTLGHRLSIYGTIFSLLIIPDILNLFTNSNERIILMVLISILGIMMLIYTVKVGSETYIPFQMFF